MFARSLFSHYDGTETYKDTDVHPMLAVAIILYPSLAFTVGFCCAINWALRRSLRRHALTGRRAALYCWIGFAEFFFAFILFGMFWPLVLTYIGSRYLMRKAHTREAARRERQRMSWARQEEAFRAAAININGWRSRGWLVLLRARYLNSLAGTKRGGWLPSLSMGRKKGVEPFFPEPMGGAQASVSGEPNIEVAEVSTLDREFARTVTTVTEISEEGIFRHVALYL
ncbi:unnamed protein product [Scytosiphon promiscuus]